MTLNNSLLRLFTLLAAAAMLFPACDDDETYADTRKRENSQIEAFLQTGASVKDEDSGEYLFHVPGNIKVISEREFYANDSTTRVDANEFVRFEKTGVYMQIVEKGTGTQLAEGESCSIITRYTEFNIATDSIQTSNCITSYEMQPDIMTCSNNYGTYSATFTQGVMKTVYNTAAVPSGWLVPLPYIKLARLAGPDDKLAHVRLIVPSTQGQSNAATSIYACCYDIVYQRGR